MNDIHQSSEFDTFWQQYPLKTGKGHARKAFEKAIKKTDLATILAGLEQYRIHKPDWKAWKHPTTWLNGECWDDEYEHQAAKGEMTAKQRMDWEARYRRGGVVPQDIRRILGLGEYAREEA